MTADSLNTEIKRTTVHPLLKLVGMPKQLHTAIINPILAKVSASIPKTSYLKLVDVWFIFCICIVFSVVATLTAINYFKVCADLALVNAKFHKNFDQFAFEDKFMQIITMESVNRQKIGVYETTNASDSSR